MIVQPDSPILVVDIEATCWRRSPPEGQISEIIEVGVCMLNRPSLDVSSKRSLLVKPKASNVSPYCTKLTTLTQAQVDDGLSFGVACESLRQDYNSLHFLWASWGDYDRRMFVEQCKRMNVAYPFGTAHLNVKTFFAACQHLTQPVGMARALKMVHMQLQGTHHRGDDDAYNIARLLAYLLARHDGAMLEEHMTITSEKDTHDA